MEIFEKIAQGFSFVGLNTPLHRFVAGSALFGALEYSLRPSYSYKEDGSPRPWNVISSAPDATLLPAGSSTIIPAFFIAQFF